MKMERLRWFLWVLAQVAVLMLAGQTTSDELRDRRRRLTRELRETTEQLASTQRERSAAMQRLNLLQRQIEQRRELIETLHAEIEINQARSQRNSDVVAGLEADLERLRSEYAQTMRAAYRAKHTNSWLTFILSADGFNSSFRRYLYLRQYQNYRTRQSRLIIQTQEMLTSKLQELDRQRQEKEELLLAADTQGRELIQALDSQTEIIDALGQDERRLAQRVEQQRREQEHLNRSIEEAIAAELAARQRNEREGSPDRATAPAAPGFRAQRGRMPWPVDGELVRAFGQQPHPDVPSVTVMNGGIDIATPPAARVQAVFAGEVISSRSVPGYRQVMMVRHGDYYTVYSNLQRTLARVGDEVEAGTTLGFMGRDDRPLHFEIWAGRDRQDPAGWLE